MEEGYIKLSRKLLRWEWYEDVNTKAVFLHCLIMANWKTVRFRGREIPRGSFITGRAKLAKELNMSERSVRTALNHLISTNELTIETSPQGSIITVVKYDEYQSTDQRNDQRPTNDRPTTDQRPTSIKEYKEYKNNKNIYSHPRKKPNEDLQEIEELYLDEVRGGDPE